MRAIIYCRVSSDPTGRGRSVSEQEAECRELCDRNGWTVAEVFTDNDIGASRYSGKDRPAWRKIREILQTGDVLVTWAASRAQRDLNAYMELRDLCAERGVLWSYSGRTYDLNRGDDRFTTALDALLSEREAENIREHVLRANRAAAEAGRPHGKVPYGYRAVRDPDTGRIVERVPHETRSLVVQEAARRILAGETIRSIARDFRERGTPPPNGAKQWLPTMVKAMVLRPTYAGIRIHQGVPVGKGAWEPLISPEDQEKLRTILVDPTRATGRGVEPVHLLTGIALCGVCGDPLRRMKSKGTVTYTCGENYCVSRRLDLVDEYVTESILVRLEDPSLMGTIGASGSESAELYAQARVLQARLDAFVEDGIAGKVSSAAVGRAEKKLMPEIAALEAQARKAASSPIIGEMAGPDAREHWIVASVEQRREVVRALVRVEVLPVRGSRRRFNTDHLKLTWLH
ncbi:recombinase family protein [Rhodococcus zopfii]|uniref:Recombinase family protein n=1 Tax=Rhodococcus zopfii TaxID=43772 RepID=A0ABU3WV36_9NOCA|nr:recombinase family protein [Rhodococcus zopfii]